MRDDEKAATNRYMNDAKFHALVRILADFIRDTQTPRADFQQAVLILEGMHIAGMLQAQAAFKAITGQKMPLPMAKVEGMTVTVGPMKFDLSNWSAASMMAAMTPALPPKYSHEVHSAEQAIAADPEILFVPIDVGGVGEGEAVYRRNDGRLYRKRRPGEDYRKDDKPGMQVIATGPVVVTCPHCGVLEGDKPHLPDCRYRTLAADTPVTVEKS